MTFDKKIIELGYNFTEENNIIKIFVPDAERINVLKDLLEKLNGKFFKDSRSSIGGISAYDKKIYIKPIESQTRGTETAVLTHLQKQFEEIANPIIMHIGSKTLFVDGVRNVKGFPKADFVFIFQGIPVLYCSHKTDDKFFQWSGFTEKGIKYHPEISKFIYDLTTKFNNTEEVSLYSKTLKRKIIDDNLKLLAVYGSGDKKVEVILKDDIHLEKIKDYEYRLTGLQYEYPEIPSGNEEPVMVARMATNRQQRILPKDFNGIRLSIFPNYRPGKEF
jgi:hypothetical protein